jgi:hypothetical protein
MPIKPKKGEKEKDFISRCIPVEMEADSERTNAQAAAICYSIWRESKKGDDEKAIDRDDVVAIIEAVLEAGNATKATDAPESEVEDDGLAVKILRSENGGVVVGGPMCWYADAEHKDLQGDYFTPETETMHDVYKSVPALFHHGLDDTLGLTVIGHRVKAEKRPEFLWVEDWLDTSNKYWEMVKPLLEAKVLYYSPGSAPHLVKREDDGRLLSYPVIEDTLTVTPAQHRSRPIEQIKAAYKAAGINLPELPEPEHEPQDDGEGDGGPSRLDVAKAKAKAMALLTEIQRQRMEV